MADAATPVLSFPAILRNPGLTNRYAHLHSPASSYKAGPSPTAKKRLREQNEGKRWIRRKDNAQFAGNPHIVVASKRDYLLQPPDTRPTFPEPLPPYLQRSAKLPSLTVPPVTDPASANAGRFSLSLKGMRRDLRRAGGRAEALVRDVESVMLNWLNTGGVLIAPDTLGQLYINPDVQGIPIGNTSSIVEVSRTPLQLVWRIPDDAFARYVVHCCARYHEVVSFSKGPSEQRLTYLLRPNVTRPDRHAPTTIDTPPATDMSDQYGSYTESDIDSDFISDNELESTGMASEDDEGHPHPPLSDIAESAPASPLNRISASLHEDSEDAWSVVESGDTDEADESGSELGIEPSVASITLDPKDDNIALPKSPLQVDPDRTLVLADSIDSLTPLRMDRHTQWSGLRRSASSPSRSPARRMRRRATAKRQAGMETSLGLGGTKRSLYEYLFS